MELLLKKKCLSGILGTSMCYSDNVAADVFNFRKSIRYCCGKRSLCNNQEKVKQNTETTGGTAGSFVKSNS